MMQNYLMNILYNNNNNNNNSNNNKIDITENYKQLYSKPLPISLSIWNDLQNLKKFLPRDTQSMILYHISKHIKLKLVKCKCIIIILYSFKLKFEIECYIKYHKNCYDYFEFKFLF
jgi:hypothetical protein